MSSLSGLSEFEEKDSRLEDHFSEKNDPMDVEQDEQENEEEESVKSYPQNEILNIPMTLMKYPKLLKEIYLKGQLIDCESQELSKKIIQQKVNYYDELTEKQAEKQFKNDLNTVRWKNLNGEQISNTKIIEWSDNTYSLCIGDQIFDINISKQDKTSIYTIYKNQIFVSQYPIIEKASLKPIQKIQQQ